MLILTVVKIALKFIKLFYSVLSAVFSIVIALVTFWGGKKIDKCVQGKRFSVIYQKEILSSLKVQNSATD